MRRVRPALKPVAGVIVATIAAWPAAAQQAATTLEPVVVVGKPIIDVKELVATFWGQ